MTVAAAFYRAHRARPLVASRRFDAVAVLTVILVLLVALPSGLVVPALGAAGTPAILAGDLALFWWVTARLVPQLRVASGRQPVRIALFIFAGAVLISFAAAMARPMTNSETLAAYRGLITVGFWMGIALVAADGITSLKRLETLLRRLSLAATVLAALGIVQFLTGFDPTSVFQHLPGLVANTDLSVAVGERSLFRRVEATAAHPIEFSVVLALAAPFAIYFALYGGRRWQLTRWLGVGIIATSILMSVSRSGILGIVVGGLVLALGWPPRRRLVALGISGAFLVGVYFAIPGMVGTIRNLFLGAGSDSSIIARTDRYAAAGKFIDQAPLFGRGFRTFLPNLYFVPDNQYLGTLIEMGIVGLLALLLVMLVPIFIVRSVRKRMADVRGRDLAQTLTASLLVPLVTCATFDVLAYQMVSGFTFMVVGCCGALWRLERARQRASPAAPARL